MIEAGLGQPLMLSLLLLLAPAIYLFYRYRNRYSYTVAGSRMAIITLLVVAAASPYVMAEEKVSEKAEIVVLKDNSRSTEILNSVDLDLGDIQVREKVIASGNSSELRSSLIRNVKPNTAYLAVSDFQSEESLEGVSEAFNRKNSTLYALKTEARDEASVTIKGPSSTVPGAESRFSVEVRSTGKTPEPSLRIDGEPVDLERTGNSTWSYSRTFTSKGSHTLQASIKANDRWSSNNRFYKAVKVTEKPDILVIGKKGSLGDRLGKFYDVTYRSSVPEDLSDYYTVVLKEHREAEQLEPYLIEGNGLVYTGDYRRDMNVLPVQSIPSRQQSKGAKIALVIDISKSTEESGSVKQEKALAYNLLEQLPYNNRVGIIAYNQDAYKVSEVRSLASARQQLKQKVSRLETGGNSFHHNGLQGGKKLLNGTGNILMITDGKITNYGRNINTARKTKNIASSLETRLITIGVGNTDRGFLRDIAQRGNGYYLEMDNTARLQFVFGAGGASGNTEPLVAVNPNHFITDGVRLSSSSAIFDPVEPRDGADLLVSGTSGKPFLTSWRYGLGRVAAFSGGARDLAQVTRVDPLLTTRTVSWTVGDPKRKQEKWIEVSSARRPGKVEAKASYDLPGFSRQGEEIYTRELSPEKLGFHGIEDSIYAYNYNREIQGIGYSDSMRETVRSTGGEVFSPDQEEEIIRKIQKTSNRKVETKKPVSSYFIIAAMIILLSEVGFRKSRGKR